MVCASPTGSDTELLLLEKGVSDTRNLVYYYTIIFGTSSITVTSQIF